MPESRPGAAVELRSRPELHRGGQREHDVPLGLHAQPRLGDEHHEHEDGAHDQRDDELQADEGDVAAALLVGRRARLRRRGAVFAHQHAIPGVLHRPGDARRHDEVGQVGDGHPFRCQVDGRPDDPGEPLDGLFHPGRACGAVHPRHGEGSGDGRHVVARGADGIDKRGHRHAIGVVAHQRLLGREVDGRLVDPGQLPQGFLHPRRAHRATHVADRDLDGLFHWSSALFR